jgi:hypothetical protein
MNHTRSANGEGPSERHEGDVELEPIERGRADVLDQLLQLCGASAWDNAQLTL